MLSAEALEYAYQALAPFSKRFSVDKKRLLFSVGRIVEVLGDVKEKRILDVGCSIGLVCLAFKKLGAQPFGLDKYIFDEADPLFYLADLANLKALWEREHLDIKPADFFTADCLGFDVVMSDAMLEHLRDPQLFLKRMFHAVRPGGYVFISTPNLTTMLQRIRFIFGRSPLWDLKDFYDLGDSFTGHWREYTLKELRFMCEWSGLEVISAWNKNMLAPFKFKWKKLPRFIARMISALVPGSRDMNFILCRRSL